jgi:hypothetical protein
MAHVAFFVFLFLFLASVIVLLLHFFWKSFNLNEYFDDDLKFPSFSYRPDDFFWMEQELPWADMPPMISPYRPLGAPPPRNYAFDSGY